MDDSKLRALLTAVQCGSFGKAAAQLGYTQSAMTHLVSKLEAELGCTLLLRSSKGVRLSEEGEHLLPYIQSVIDAGDALRHEAEEQGQVYGRALRIGCFASIARARLPELLGKFRKQHPEIKVDVLVQGNELAAALEALDTGDYGQVLRAKGIVAGTDGKWLHFDYVPGEVEIRNGAAGVTGRLCVIGAELKEDALTSLFHLN